MKSLVETVGIRIRQLRTERGMSLAELGRQTGTHPSHLKDIEDGKYACCTRTLQAIATALGVAPADLLTSPDDDLGAIVELMRTHPERVAEIRERVTNHVVN